MLIEYDSINKYYNNKLDVITYLNLSKEFNVIKKILLDDTEHKAIEIINNEYKIDEPVNLDSFLPKFEEYIISNNNVSEVKKRLLSYFKLDEVKYNNLIDEMK